MLADVEETETLLTAGRTTPQGILHVSLPVTLGRQFVIPALPRFATQYPGLRVVALLDDRRVDLMEAGVDVALRIGALEDSALIARRIYETRAVAVASPEYLALHGVAQTPADLAQHECLGLYSADRAAVLDWVFGKDGQRTVVTPGGRLSVSNGEALLELAVAGAGIVMILDLLARRWIASGALTPLLADWLPDEAMPISLVYLQNRHLSAKVRVFCDFVAGLFPRRRD
ncbi:MAG TPA: substrate binding domain-containing protein [Burkholderiales bacterium]|nr:substrate binding domain-containing protein [Burkholderiales bacterium]